ncbi:cation diffusion facilitator family transporter [Bacillus sp. S/N-304-OC-R1]|uniref:cation diffusion facilitator family transporter n=1 Tax=Bacillus sp. S/N-304-OC-R1 TaxID=2758034 RepID=UPI001C8ECF03|nr:cation diffusion facilitator family transporter [Bacillus sp. S/N-304-OC-R1]MBY0124343.1 cation transporter [Bacillus sp. S/N-304-OC-R1]
MEQQRYDQLKMGEKGAIISIVAYICLSFLKLLIGYSTGSEALKADGLNNVTDIIASTAVLIGLKLSRKPADDDHPYGHWKAENVATLVASFIMMAVGIQVVYEAITSFFDLEKTAPDLTAAWTGIFCAAVMFGVYRYNKKLASRINSQSLMAAAKDNLSDAWVSIGAAAGIIGSQFQLPWLDPLAAIIVGFLICRTAWEIFREASHHLTDGFDENLIEDYKETILSTFGVKGIKEIKARNYGNNTVVDIVILVNSNLNLQDAHDISTIVENALIKEHGVYTVHVHVEPNTAIKSINSPLKNQESPTGH